MIADGKAEYSCRYGSITSVFPRGLKYRLHQKVQVATGIVIPNYCILHLNFELNSNTESVIQYYGIEQSTINTVYRS